MNGILHLGALAIAALMLVNPVEVRSASASSAILNEPGDPYNRPIRLPRPDMICAVGEISPRVICPARLAPPLSSCRCYGTEDIGLRYFVFQSRSLPTVFSYDGFAW